MREVTKAIIRLIAMAVLAVNSLLTAKGMNPIPFDEAAFTEWALYAVTTVSGFWAWWKNNNVTRSARTAQQALNALKYDYIDDGEGDE